MITLASRSRSACRPATRSRASLPRRRHASGSRRRDARLSDHHPGDPAGGHLHPLGHLRHRPRRQPSCTPRWRCRSSCSHLEHLRRDLGGARGGGDDARLQPRRRRVRAGWPCRSPCRASRPRRSSSFIISWNEVFAASTADAATPRRCLRRSSCPERVAASVPLRRRLLPARAVALDDLLHPSFLFNMWGRVVK